MTDEVPRGITGVVQLTAPVPEQEAAATLQALTRLGLRPERLPATGRVVIQVDVADAQVDAFRGWAEPRGMRVFTAGRYRVFIDPR